MKQELKQLADISGHKILGNPNSEKGNIQEIDMGFGLSFSGGTVSVDLELNDLIDVTTNFPLNPTEADDGKMLFYDHSIGEWTTGDAVTHGTVVINGKKASAGTISKGLPVYLVGFDNDIHTVELANATSGSTMPVIGFTAENMNSTNSKHIITFGKLTGINTTSTVTTLNPNGETWVVNDALYMSTITGGLTKFRPTGGSTQIQRIAKVLRVHSNGGQLFIFNTARTAGLPNLTTDKLWMGSTSGQPIEMSLGDGFSITSSTISVDPSYGNLYVESTGGVKSTVRTNMGGFATEPYSSVFGGCVNTSSACYGTILNGRMNTILGGPYNSILNGNSNTNSGYISSNITSGTNNIIATPSHYSTIDNGTNNNVNGCYSVILNGSSNYIEPTSQYSIIGSGVSNDSVGSFNVINSGQSNTIDGTANNISTGRFNTISGPYNNISTGTYNTVSGNRNFIGSGSSNTLTGTCMSVLGNNIVATYSNTTYVNKLIINDTPTTNNSNTNLLVRNSSGQIELREASSFSGTNFANTDLALTASRTHQLNGFDLTISGGTNSTDRALVINSFKDVYTRGKGDQNNLVLGFNTGRAITSAANNVILGDLAGQNITTAQNTVLIGRSAGAAITTTANQTVAIGRGALENITVSSDNTAIGYNSLNSQTSSQFNTAVGSLAGSTNVSGGSNVFIGRNAQPLNSTDNSSIVIGANAVGLGGGTAVIGSSSITRTQLRGRVEMDTTTDGILLPRLTTAQMNAIASPVTNTILYNTDLNGLYRYNGSSWVALSSGYGIIGVYSGSGNGTPTFFATLQDALETCKASGGYFTVKLFSNITITSSISVNYTLGGVGNAYNYRQLTIDFNGFSVTNAQSDTSDVFNIQMSSDISVYQEIRFINGTVRRTNGTGTHHALKCDTINRYGTIQMSNMYWYCQNSHSARIGLRWSTALDANRVSDLGGSVFISNGTQRTMVLSTSNQIITNFSCISNSSLDALYISGSQVQNFYAENTSSGRAIIQDGGLASNFNIKSNSGICLEISGSGSECHNFVAKSTSGVAIKVNTSATVTNFKCDTGNNFAMQVDGGGVAINGFCQNNSNTNATIQTSSHNRMDNIEGINLGTSFGGRIQGGNLTKCKFISVGGIGAQLYSWGPYPPAGLIAEGCHFESRLNTSAGHSCQVVPISSGVFLLTNCYFFVTNAGANALNATGATTVRSRYCTDNEVATTPINANVTIVASRIIS